MGDEEDAITLESSALHPFEGGWCEWYADERNVVVTFITIDHLLYTSWIDQCADYEDGEFHLNGGLSVDEEGCPGIRKEDSGGDEDPKERYTIILPYDFMSERLCRQWLEKLNEQYGEDFELSVETAFEVMYDGDIVSYDIREDVLYVYLEHLDGGRRMKTERTDAGIEIKRDYESGDILGFAIPHFSVIKHHIERQSCLKKQLRQ